MHRLGRRCTVHGLTETSWVYDSLSCIRIKAKGQETTHIYKHTHFLDQPVVKSAKSNEARYMQCISLRHVSFSEIFQFLLMKRS